MSKIYQDYIAGNVQPDARELNSFVPTIFIGLGGTGKDVLMRLRKRFRDEHMGPQPGYVKHLILDTDKAKWWPEGEDESDYLTVKPEDNELLSCEITEPQFFSVFNAMEKQRDKLYVGWLKPEMKGYGPGSVIKGAGCHRQFGRMAFMLHYHKIREQLKAHIENVLEYAAKQPAGGGIVERDVIEIIMLTSLAGGTGSGMFIDMAYLVKDVLREATFRALRQRYTSLIAVLPTAFEGQGSSDDFKKYQQNAYAALLELENYGTSRSDDELFLGPAAEKNPRKHRVGLTAPWKDTDDNFIEGSGWEACYLIDNTNRLNRHAPLSLQETYQMIADYLFLDFQQSAFAVRKRSSRCNLTQYQQGYIVTRVKRDEKKDATHPSAEIQQDKDVVYASHNGCTFSSFGLAEISFDKDRVYRAAAYRLAVNLIRLRWLAPDSMVAKSEYERMATEDLFKPKSGASFMPDALVARLYLTNQGNWLDAITNDMDEVRSLGDFTKGSGLLRDLLSKHKRLLGRVPDTGSGGHSAIQSVHEQKIKLCGTPTDLGELRSQLQSLARARANAFGLPVVIKLLDLYRKGFDDITTRAKSYARPDARATADLLARLMEADLVYFPTRMRAQKIEFPLACDGVQQYVIADYNRAAASSVEAICETMKQYVGKHDERPPADLNRLGTLHGHFDSGNKFLNQVKEQLEKQFKSLRTDKGSNRKQSLLTAWEESKYDELINAALLTSPKIGKAESPVPLFGFNWVKLQEEMLQRMRMADQLQKEQITSMCGFVDYWLERKVNAQNVERAAEELAKACLDVLKQEQLNLAAFYNGVVTDILMIDETPDERRNKLQQFVFASDAYLPFDAQFLATVTGNYQPKPSSILGRKAGEDQKFSEAYASQIESETLEVSSSNGGGRNINVLEGNPSTLVLCREVWGVPLQHYALLGDLHKAYHGGNRKIDECHINYHEAFEDLPDVRALEPSAYEKIRDYVDNVLHAMMVGTIICDNEGVFNARIPDPISGDIIMRLGRRLNRILRKACEDGAVRSYLEARRQKWEKEAVPKKWAMLHISAQWTYEATKIAIFGQQERSVPPLHNCCRILLETIRDKLQTTEEGRRWSRALGIRILGGDAGHEDHEGNGQPHSEELLREIQESGILQQVSEYIPIYRVDWSKIDRVTLPSDSIATKV